MTEKLKMVTVLLASHAHHTAELSINGKSVSVPKNVPTVIPAEYAALMGDSGMDFTVIDGDVEQASVVQTVAPVGEGSLEGLALKPKPSSEGEGGDTAAAAAANEQAERDRIAQEESDKQSAKAREASAKRTATAKAKADAKKAKTDEAARKKANEGLPGGDPPPQDNGQGGENA